MKRTLASSIAVLAVLSLASVAGAQSDCTKIVPASPWGPNDQTGATNRITAAVTKAAAAEIQSGKVVTMTYPLVDGVPLFGSRFTKTILTATGLAPGGALGENQLTYMEDTWLSQSHVGTHLDGMGHIGRQDCYYNQNAMGKFINQNYMTKLGLEHLKSFATRGVIVDMVKVFQAAGKLKGNTACKKPCLDKGTLITAADIQAGLKMYNVTLREGDILIIHTGMGRPLRAVPGPERDLQQRRAGHRQGCRHVADRPEDRGGGDRHLGGGGDPGRESQGSVHRSPDADHRQRHPHHRERAHRLDGRRGGGNGPRDLLLQHDRAQGRRDDG